MSDGPLIEIRDLTKHFGGVVACDSISLTVDAGEIVGLIGPNGAGKTTLFNCVAGAYRPDAGHIYFRRRRVDRLSAEQVTRHGIARTFQNMRPFSSLTLLENVMVAALSRHRSLRAARQHAMEMIEYVDLAGKSDTLASGLSTGQRKRLELARALATGPELLLMDEVTGGVDQATIPGLLKLVRKLRGDGLTLLVIEHNMQVIRDLSDRLIAMNFGKVIADGAPADVVRKQEVIDAYLGASHA